MYLSEYIAILLLLFISIGLWWLYAFGYQGYRIDLLRHRLFGVRDDLFLYWAKHNLDFDHKGYCMLRYAINGSLRYSHNISVLRIAFMLFDTKKDLRRQLANQYERRFEKAVKQLPKHAQEKLRRARKDMHLAILSHLVYTSIFAFSMLVPLLALYKLSGRFNPTHKNDVISNNPKWKVWDAEMNIREHDRDLGVAC